MNPFKKKSLNEASELFAALDIGSSKVCCAIAKINDRPKGDSGTYDSGQMRVIGIGQQISKGIKGASIIDLEALEDSILNAVHSAEKMANHTISGIYVNLSAGCVISHNLRAEIQLSSHAVDETHLRRLLNLSRDTSIPADRQIIHVLPLSYTLDDVRGIRDPRGMYGNKLSVMLHVVSAPIGIMKNLISCIGRCHLDIAGFVVAPYASGLSTLVEDELELGVTLIDMGGGTTTMASFAGENLINVINIPVGGAHITHDIARGLATPLAQAERLKTLYGTLISSSSDDGENILVSQMGEIHSAHTHQVPKKVLTHIIRSRVEEIFELISFHMKNSGIDPLVYQRIVITGGGSQLPGLLELATNTLEKQVRLGQPTGLSGFSDIVTNPMFSTCAGLLQYGLQDYTGNQASRLSGNRLQLWHRLSNWVRENF